MPRAGVEHAALVSKLQAELWADDLVPPPGSIVWSERQLREWFESGGLRLPSGGEPAPTRRKGEDRNGVAPSDAAMAAAAGVRTVSLGVGVGHRAGSVAKYTLLKSAQVRTEAEGGEPICELDAGAVIVVDSEAVGRGGGANVRIIDPVWRGWLRSVCDRRRIALVARVDEPPRPDAPPPQAEPPPAGPSADGAVDPDAARPMAAAEVRARDAGEWAVGTMVLLRGLTGARELNGRSGVLDGWDAARGRYEVHLANRIVRARPAQIEKHPMQLKQERQARGDEVIFASADERAARAGTYAVRLDAQFWYDQALDRVFSAANEFEVLSLPVEWTDDLNLIKRQYRKISLAVHPDKNRHPQADAAFRKVYGAFETLSDPNAQRRLLFMLGLGGASDAEVRAFGEAGGEDDDDALFQWWWEASVPEVEKAAEEAEGGRFDSFAAAFVSDGLGGNVDDVRWVGLRKAIELHRLGRALFIDCREGADCDGGLIPGAYHVPMSSVQSVGIVDALGRELIHALLSERRHQLIIVYSNVATPFSRCRAFCRWLLRAGHKTLPSARFRRLRGGIFGWTHRGGAVAARLTHRGGRAAPRVEVPAPTDEASMGAKLREANVLQQQTIDVD